MASSNYNVLHTFVEGLKADFINHAESNNSYQNSLNGRLYSRNGILSFSSIKGTKKVWENVSLKKYLGYWAFDDELIIFCKSNKEVSQGEEDPNIDYEIVKSELDYYKEPKDFIIDGVELDKTYEAKCLPYIESNDCLWIVGKRL